MLFLNGKNAYFERKSLHEYLLFVWHVGLFIHINMYASNTCNITVKSTSFIAYTWI